MTPSTSQPELWLVRTTDNRLDGPFSKAEVCRLVQAGELGPQDEVCRAGGYWISLHEQQEVMDQLGIRAQFQKTRVGASGLEEEITETQTEVTEAQGQAAGPDGDIPELPSEADLAGTAVIRRAKKPLGKRATAPQGPLKMSVRGISQLERPSFWRGAAWILVLTAGLLIYSVLKVLSA